MKFPIKLNKKSILLNLGLFSALYFGLVLLERQVLRRGYLGFSLPFKLGLMGTIGGFALGALLVVALSILLQDRGWILRLILLGSLVVGSVYLNYFLFRFYFPPADVTSPGNLALVGELRWQHDYPYEMYAAAFEKYYLRKITANPDLENYPELSRIARFGVYLVESAKVPATLSEGQFLQIEDSQASFEPFLAENGQEIRLYDPGAGDLLLTSYNNLILVIPQDWLGE
jgi:hypothetical protein